MCVLDPISLVFKISIEELNICDMTSEPKVPSSNHKTRNQWVWNNLENGSKEWSYTGVEHDTVHNADLNVYEQDGAIIKVDTEIDIDIV